MKKLLLTLAILCLIATPSWAAVFQNGSFEGSPPPTTFTTLFNGSTAISGGWTVGGSVDQGGVDWIGGYWQNSEGKSSVDLSGNAPGWIYQTFDTKAGTTYRVRFDMAGNVDSGRARKELQASAGNYSGSFYFDTTGKSLTDMGWATKEFFFTAAGSSTTLTFTSMETDAYGPALDNVNVAPVPIPGAVWLLGSGFFGLVIIRRKRSK